MAMPNEINRVRLEIHASGLRNVAGAFKGVSDPYCVVTLLANDPNEKPIVLGKTEVIKNTLNPRWTTHFDLNYHMGTMTRVNIGVYDEVRQGSHKSMGSAVFEIGEILGTRGATKAKKLRGGGTIFCRVSSAPPEGLGNLLLQLKGVKLRNTDGFFGKSDPFFEACAQVDSAGGLTWHPVYRSNYIENNLDPQWELASIDMYRLCQGDYNKPVCIEVFDWDKSGKHTPMGRCETTVQNILDAQGNSAKGFTLLHKNKNFGQLEVVSAKIQDNTGYVTTPVNALQPAFTGVYSKPGAAPLLSPSIAQPMPPQQEQRPSDVPEFSQALNNDPPKQTFQPSASTVLPPPLPPPMAPPAFTPAARPAATKPKFVDYLMGGCEIDMCVAIDFTGSNGDPRKPGTLHYIHPDGQLNDYEKAITAVGSIIAKYDHDKLFPVWGFGAKFGGRIQHCFQVGHSDALNDIPGVIKGYRDVFTSGLTMSGPTVFAEVIQMAAARARSKREADVRIGNQSYTVLLILTDGAVSDVELTKQSLISASDAPLSVVVVGIGSADFGAMRFLDDFQKHTDGRDICQFVEFSRFSNDRQGLTRETLGEIPDQLVDYFVSRGVKPMPPISGSQISLAVSEPDEQDIDLSLTFNDEGEISLENYNGAVYDDTKYGTYQNYSNGPSAPTQSNYNAPTNNNYGAPSHNNYSAPSHNNYSAPPAQPPADEKIFHVQVPPGVGPGQQLRIQNPFTGQQMLVTIPQGVSAGGKFGVRS